MLKGFQRLLVLVVGWFGSEQLTGAAPTDLDPAFQFSRTNITNIQDIALFPDGTIAYAGGGTESNGKADSSGYVLPVNRGHSPAFSKSIALDVPDGAFYIAGIPRSGDFPVIRFAAFEDFGWSINGNIRGTASTILRQPDRSVVAGGRLTVPGNTNDFFGLIRFALSGEVDRSFTYTNSVGMDVTHAVLLADRRILTSFTTTNGDRIARWNTDGTRDGSYDDSWIGAANARVTAMRKAPGTGGVVVALETSQTGSPSGSLARLDEEGRSLGMPGPRVRGTIHAIAFEAVSRAALMENGFDRILVGGEFDRVEETEVHSLAAVTTNHAVVWGFGPAQRPAGAIHAIEVQPDGKVLIGGSFTNLGGDTNASVFVRLQGNNRSGQTYVYWANEEFRVFEKDGFGELVLRRSGRIDDALTLDLSLIPVTGSREDLGEIPVTIGFAAGSDAARVRVPLSNDSQREERERFAFSVTSPSENLLLTRPGTELVILDDETPGTLDPTFRPEVRSPSAIALLPDGRLRVGLLSQDSAIVLGLNPDGSRDESFITNGIPAKPGYWSISQIIRRSDGAFYVGGRFDTSSNRFGINHVARLNGDGSLDPTFDPRLSITGNNLSEGAQVGLLADESLLVWLGRSISRENAGFGNGLLRMDSSGKVLKSYPLRNWRDTALIEPHANGDVFLYSPNAISLNGGIVRLPKDGTAPQPFASVPGTYGYVYDMEAADNWLYVVGSFDRIDSFAVSKVARFDLTTGALDTNFNVAVNTENIWEIEQYEDRLYLGGEFTVINGHEVSRMARLHLDGSVDTVFDPGYGPNRGAGEIVVQPDGRILMLSYSDHVDGLPMPALVRLEGDPATASAPVLHVSRRGAELVIEYTGTRLEASADLETWTTVHAGGGEVRVSPNGSSRFFRAAGL